jgi:hypothetical protein
MLCLIGGGKGSLTSVEELELDVNARKIGDLGPGLIYFPLDGFNINGFEPSRLAVPLSCFVIT